MNSLVNHLDLTSMPVIRFMIPDHCSFVDFVNWPFKDCLIQDLSDILIPSDAFMEHCLSQLYNMLCSMIIWSTLRVILCLWFSTDDLEKQIHYLLTVWLLDEDYIPQLLIHLQIALPIMAASLIPITCIDSEYAMYSSNWASMFWLGMSCLTWKNTQE